MDTASRAHHPARGPLVRAAELVEALRAPEPPIVLDVRWHLRPPTKARRRARTDPAGLEDYDAGHVPGAVFVDLDTELAGPPGPAGRHPLPDPDVLEETLRRAGIGPASTVVVYDGGDGLAAARAWWVLRWAGMAPERVLVLDGGFPAWTAARGEVSTASGGVRRPGTFAVAGDGMPVLTADAAARVASGSGALLDARAPERYRGEIEPLDPTAGHIPGAVNAPASSLLGPDGAWRSPTELRAELEPLIDGEGGAVGAYCGSGVSAAMLVLALEHAGLRGPENPAGLYVGSWSHWCATERAVETDATVRP